MIITHCRFTGLPLAAVATFQGYNIKTASTHPIFDVPVAKLIDMAKSAKVVQLTADEQVLMGMALAHSTGLVKYQSALHLPEATSKSEIASARFLSVAKALAETFHALAAAPKQIAKFTEHLPYFRVCGETQLPDIANWCRLTSVKASAYLQTGKEIRQPDERYGFAAVFLDDNSKLSRTQEAIKNTDYRLPQVFDADIGLWAYDLMCDEFSQATLDEQHNKFKDCFRVLTMTGSSAAKAGIISTMRDMLETILPSNTPLIERRKQLTLAYLDKVMSEIITKTAGVLGERLSTEVRTVGNKQWAYVVLAPVNDAPNGEALGAGAPTIAASALASVKAGHATNGAAVGYGLDSAKQAASVAQSAAQQTPQAPKMVAALRDKLRARGLGR